MASAKCMECRSFFCSFVRPSAYSHNDGIYRSRSGCIDLLNIICERGWEVLGGGISNVLRVVIEGASERGGRGERVS